jgi:hypothetical protein
MKRVNIGKHIINVATDVIDDTPTIIDTTTTNSNSNSSNSTKSGGTSSDYWTHNQNNNITFTYDNLLTIIQGTLLVASTDEYDMNVEDNTDKDDAPTNDNPHDSPSEDDNESPGFPSVKIPTIYDFAHGKNVGQKKLDQKQSIAYQVVCCTFLLQLVYEGANNESNLGKLLGATLEMPESTQKNKQELINDLKARGGKDQLIMFLSGGAGCGKSTTMELAQQYAHRFCTAIATAFNDYSFYFTATTGSAAALFNGSTIHSAAHLNKTRLTDEMRSIWREDVRILIIDEISFFTASDVAKLDKQLKKLTGRYDMVYGGVSIVFSGDFHQLKPICGEEEVLYSNSSGASLWENSLNCCIFLDNSHRFQDDPLYGEILARMRMGEDTEEDRHEINKRVIGYNSLSLPDSAPDACYACPTNKQRNGVTAAAFRKHIMQTHPNIDTNELPPDHTLMIEATITTSGQQRRGNKRQRREQKKISQAVHDTIITQLGDDDIRATNYMHKNAKIEPVLRLYPGAHQMCITNDNLDEGRGNGTLCKCINVKLKQNGRERKWKNWDGKKVWTVGINNVDWIELEHFPTQGNSRRTFKLTPQTFSATINFPLSEGITVKLGNASITQIPINANIATTGHKLQGMSKDILIINDWNYKCANWIYVVLSRVRTLKGLYLMKPLDLNKKFNVPQELIRFEQRMKALKETPILNELGYYQQTENI